MSVIIRLQGLPWSASALDIRNFFRGLIIPQGGVHIIGGEKGDAFIAFSSDEDARQAMMRNNAPLNGISVQLFLSSKSEMQCVIDEARNRDVSSVAVVPARMAAAVPPPVPNSGTGQDYQNQLYPVSQDMTNQRTPHQPGYPKPDPSQGQFPGMPSMAQGHHNQMQNPMQHGQQGPDRGNQFGFQEGRHQDLWQQQQNVPAGKQRMDNEGQDPWAQGYQGYPPDRNAGKGSQQGQWNTGGFDNSSFEGQEGGNQWYHQGPDFGAKQPYYGGNQPPQGQGPGFGGGDKPPQGHGPGFRRDHAPEQYNSSAAEQDAQFPQQQRRDQPYNPESFWQEDYGTGNRDSFPRMGEQPGPQRGGILPHPGGQGSEPTGVPNAEFMPGPEDHMRFSVPGRPDMEHVADMKKGQGRAGGQPGESYTAEEQRFPPNRREGGPARGPRQAMFPDAKSGILPTPDMANPDQPKDYNNDSFYSPETVEQGHWANRGEEERQGYEPGRGRGQFPPRREPDGRDASMGRGRSFDGPDSKRPRDRPRRSRFDQVDEKPMETGPDGRPQERGFGGRPGDDHRNDRSMDRRPDRRSEREPASERGSDRRPRRGHDGQSHERERDDWSGSDRRNQGRSFGGESDGRPFDRASEKRPLERGPGGPPADRDHPGIVFDRNENRDSLGRDPQRRPFKRGPDGRPKEGGLLGRAPDRRPPLGGPEGHPGGEHGEHFDKGRSEPGRQFEGPPGRFDGPPGDRFAHADMEFDPEGLGDPGMSGRPGRGFRGGRDFDDQGRDRRDHGGRGHDRRNEGPRGGRGFNRDGHRGRGRGRRPFDEPESFGQYPDRYEEGHFEDVAMEEMHRGGPFPHPGDMEHGPQFGWGEGGPRHPGRPMRGRPDGSPEMPMDRRQMGRGREAMDRNRRREPVPDEPRGKGLLGDAPGGLLPTPPVTRPDVPEHLHDDFQRDQDRHQHWREDRDAGREDRPSRRSDHRQARDRSPGREQRRSDRDRDRSEHRDRSSNRDSKDPGNRGAERSGRGDKKSDEPRKEMPNSKFIHAKGFPAAYTTMEIQRFFFGCDLLFTGINVVKNAHGQNTGEAYLEFPTEDQAKKAIAKNGETIFGTPISLAFTTKQEFDEKTNTAKEKDKSSNSSQQNDTKGTQIVKINGLPPNIKREDLVNFFSSVKLASGGKSLVIEYDDKKQATGTAYIMAASQKDFDSAMSYDGHILGSKALQLSAGQEIEMDACIAKQEDIKSIAEQPTVPQEEKPPAGPGVMGARPPLMGVAPPRRPPLYAQKPLMNMGPDTPRNGPATDPHLPRLPPPMRRPPVIHGPGFCVQIQGLPMLATYDDIRAFFSGLNIAERRGVQIAHDGNGKPTGEGFVEFVSQEDKDKALKKDKTSLGSQIVAVKSIAKGDMIERLRNARLSSIGPPHDPSGPPFPPRRPPEGPGPFMAIPPHLLNPRWFYISCQNFPPGVAVPDIVDFFHDYNPIPESIRQLYADDGTSTGNAVVAFFSMEDAEMALEDMNGMLFGQSMVILQPIK
ncbi:uncharacterized protein LOC143285393 [Babylonia areolata]|uniref:uncharacterized protein LOC143285393 n=1 Tax=Babylonia areolata TaxID=304850 RepID=UPI003FD44196